MQTANSLLLLGGENILEGLRSLLLLSLVDYCLVFPTAEVILLGSALSCLQVLEQWAWDARAGLCLPVLLGRRGAQVSQLGLSLSQAKRDKLCCCLCSWLTHGAAI